MSVVRQIAVFLCGLLLQCRAQVVFPGSCPDVAAMTDFNLERYLGKWYENEKYFALFELGGRCITATYSLRDNGVVSVANRQISSLPKVMIEPDVTATQVLIYSCKDTGMKSELIGEATQVSRSDEGKLSVRFPSLPVAVDAPYWVVDTDYDNYALVWSCYELGFLHTRSAWILTRERNPPLSTLENAYGAAERNNINKSFFMRTDQRNCPDDE